MSGIEVAGLLLGSFPLMISALEHYRETEEVLSTWWMIEKEYSKCMYFFTTQQGSLTQALEELLLPIIEDEEKLKALLAEPGGPLWRDPSLERLLRNRMPDTYTDYLHTIDMLKDTIKDIHKALGTHRVHFQSRLANEMVSCHSS